MKPDDGIWQPAEPATLSARRVLPQLIREYFKAGRKLHRGSNKKKMHRFRLKTKQLRYTLDMFLPLYGRGLESKAARLRPIQNALGDANDCEVLLSEMGKDLPHKVRSYVEKRADEKRKEFLQYWRKEFDAEGEARKWEQYLARSTRSKPAQS